MLFASSRPWLRILTVLSLIALPLVACGASDSPSGDGGGHDLTGALTAQGFAVQNASFEFIDMSMCCASSCYGNNPSSPYGAFFVPRALGQTAANRSERADGTSMHFRMREDEAILFVGPTPPEVRYFGFTPYLDSRVRANGTQEPVQASLSETLNNLVIGVDAPAGAPVFAQRTAVIAAADAKTVSAAKAALVASGIPSSAINVMVFDPAIVQFGLQDAADTLTVLFRMAIPTDPPAFEAYRRSPGAALYRLTPTRDCAGNVDAACAPSPLPSPEPRPKDTRNSEIARTASVDALHDAIVAAYPGYTANDLRVQLAVLDPAACIAGRATCLYDNRDTIYPGIESGILFASDDDFYVVYGVDHQLSKKASYDNASVYAKERRVGLTGVIGDAYPGSAQPYISTDANELYAWKIARDCTNTPHCLQVPKGDCPTGIENDKLGSIVFRMYLEPTSKTAPDPSTLVLDRVIQFKKR